MKRGIIFLQRTLKAILNGSLFLQIHLDKHLLKFVVVMFMGLLTIWTSLLIDNTLTKVKRNNDIIKEQQNIIAAKTFQLSEISCRSKLEDLLEEQGSSVCPPEKPAKRLK